MFYTTKFFEEFNIKQPRFTSSDKEILTYLLNRMVDRRFGNSITDHWQSDPDDALDASHNSPDYDCNEQVARMNNSDHDEYSAGPIRMESS